MSLRILFLSNLFPDASQSIRGLDNVTLLHSLAQKFGAKIRVIAPRPVLSLRKPLSTVISPRPDDAIFRPIYVPIRYVPRIGSRFNDQLAQADLRETFRAVVGDFQPDVVLTSWLYPDGCAVARLCQEVGLPSVLITQGSDTHVYLSHSVRRQKILNAIAISKAVICRSGDLARRLEEAGANRDKLKIVYNGVDETIFRPTERCDARGALGISDRGDDPILLFVGNLLPVKNPLFLVRAHAELNRRRAEAGQSLAHLQMIGEGPLRKKIARESQRLGSHHFLTLAGRQAPEVVAKWMAASQILCLSSENEGFPNVILEAMACHLPVVSTRVGGISELISGAPEGILTPPGDFAPYVEALESTLKDPSPVFSQRNFGWKQSASQYSEILTQAAM